MIIEVVANCPKDVQDNIVHLIGKRFKRFYYENRNSQFDKEMFQNGEVAIDIDNNNTIIVLNKNEYKIIKTL